MVLVFTNHVYWIHDSRLFLCLSFFVSENMCTVVYFDDCVSIRQCKLYCESMGGSKYRWFHNACCQCIGPECVDYGSKAVKCMNCLFWSVGTLVPNVWMKPEDWGKRKLWLLCVSIPQLPCKIPPKPLLLLLQIVFILLLCFTVYF